MSSTYTGTATTVNPATPVTITIPSDGDPASAASVNTPGPFEYMTDRLASLVAGAAIKAIANTFTASQTFDLSSGAAVVGINGGADPSAAGQSAVFGVTYTGSGVKGEAQAFGGVGVRGVAGSGGTTAVMAEGTGGGAGLVVTGGATIDVLTVTTPTPIYPSLSNGFTNNRIKCHYYKDSLGIVSVYIDATTSAGTDHAGLTIFTLPSGYRPAAGIDLAAILRVAGPVVSTGIVSATSGGAISFARTDGVVGNLIGAACSFSFNPSATT